MGVGGSVFVAGLTLALRLGSSSGLRLGSRQTENTIWLKIPSFEQSYFVFWLCVKPENTYFTAPTEFDSRGPLPKAYFWSPKAYFCVVTCVNTIPKCSENTYFWYVKLHICGPKNVYFGRFDTTLRLRHRGTLSRRLALMQEGGESAQA